MGIEHQKILCFDRGDHTYLAEKLAEEAEKVWFYTPILGRQPTTKDDMIGSGLDGVEKIDDFEKYKDKADLVFFPAEYDGEKCDSLRKEGHRVFGSGLSADIELNRILFLETIEKVGLKAIKTYRADGFDDAIEYLTGKTNKWIKTPYCRGDFDTLHYDNMQTFEPWFDFQRAKLGKKGSEIKVLLIQDDFPSVVEVGLDRYCIDGKYTAGMVGYEVKDKGYIGKVFSEFPPILENVDQKMSPVYKKYGYRGAYSTENRINEKEILRFTDLTARFGSPPGEVICEIFDHPKQPFGQTVFDIADGKVPNLHEIAPYAAVIILTSYFNETNEICVDYPKEYKQNIKLKNHYKHKGHYYCVPNNTDGYFGAVATWGNSIKEVTEKAKEIASQVMCLGLEYDENVFDKAQEVIKKGEQFGIKF